MIFDKVPQVMSVESFLNVHGQSCMVGNAGTRLGLGKCVISGSATVISYILFLKLFIMDLTVLQSWGKTRSLRLCLRVALRPTINFNYYLEGTGLCQSIHCAICAVSTFVELLEKPLKCT